MTTHYFVSRLKYKLSILTWYRTLWILAS